MYLVQLTDGQCCGAGADRSRGFFCWSRGRFKIWAGTRADFLGSAPACFLASEKQNDLKMFIFHCICTFTYFCIINSTVRYLLTLPTVIYSIKLDKFFWMSSVVEPKPAGAGLFWWSRSRWKSSVSGMLLCGLGVLWWQSSDTSYKI